MSKNKSDASGTELMSVQERIAARLAAVDKSTSVGASNRISVKGSQFTLPDGTQDKGPLNCIIVDYINMNTFYEGTYNPNDIKGPACRAVGRNLKEMAPSADCETPVNADCDTCPNNAWGSEGRGKACKNGVVLALLPEGFTDDSELLTINISPTGVSAWSSYVRSLSALNMDPIGVVTSIRFKEGVTYPSLLFKQVGGNDNLDGAGAYMAIADDLLVNM